MSNILNTNRRDGPRRSPRGHIKVELRLGKCGMGPNAADTLLDLSQHGARVAVKSEFPLGANVELVLTSASHPRPIRVKALVVRTHLEVDGLASIGLRFHAPLPYAQWQQLTREPIAHHAASSATSGASLSKASPVRSPAES